MLKFGIVTVKVTVVLCWIPPPLPVTEIGYVPATVGAPTVMVMVDVPPPGAAIAFGLKLTVVPLGAPDDERLIALLKPPVIVVVIVEVPWFPATTVTVEGAAEIVKVGAAVTVSETDVVCWIPPPLPVTVMGYVPAAVPAPTVIVMVEVPPPGAAIALGLKLTVVPVGTPDADKLIALLKPPLIAVVIVEVPWLPCATLAEPGDAEIVKFPVACAAARNATICMTHRPDGLTGATAL